MISKGFCLVAFFEGAKASSFYIHLSCPVYIQFAVRGVWSRLFYGPLECGLPEVSIISFLPPQFSVSKPGIADGNLCGPNIIGLVLLPLSVSFLKCFIFIHAFV
jgi:hypothetical protein